MAQKIIITAAGRAALVNAANIGTHAVEIKQIGLSDAAITPTPGAVDLPGEHRRLSTIAGNMVAADTIHMMVRDESDASYMVRSFALYLADGTLFALYGQAPVLVEKSQQSTMLLAVDIQFADVDADQLIFGDTNFLMPPATEQVQGVIEIATFAEAQEGSDHSRALTPAAARQALLDWLLAQDGAGSGIDADLLDGQHASAFLQAALFTGAQILSRVVTVDGAGSGLDADLLDGQHASAFLQASLFTNAQILAMLLAVDGAGSGIDADLLDGQHGNYYADVIARLGYTPLNILAYTAADVIAKLLGVDGAGSGLDADLLDGQHGSYYADVIARLGYTPANKAGDTFSGPIRRDARFYLDLLSGNPSINLDSSDYLRYDRASDDLVLVIGGIVNRIFHQGNDGAGSGIDADMLDGQHGSSFLKASQFTAAQILAMLLAVDGAGSGLDADLLDGQQGSWYSNIPARLGYTPLNAILYTAADILSKLRNVDGAGSGLDADLLDGHDGASYDRIVSMDLRENGGYIRYASGYKRCWGRATANGNSSTTITYPITFDRYSNASFSSARTSSNAQDNDPQVYACSRTNCTVYSASDNGLYGFWRAEGE